MNALNLGVQRIAEQQSITFLLIAKLSEQTGLTPATIGKALHALEELSMVQELTGQKRAIHLRRDNQRRYHLSKSIASDAVRASPASYEIPSVVPA